MGDDEDDDDDVSIPLYSACRHAAVGLAGGGAVPAASCRTLGVAAANTWELSLSGGSSLNPTHLNLVLRCVARSGCTHTLWCAVA